VDVSRPMVFDVHYLFVILSFSEKCLFSDAYVYLDRFSANIKIQALLVGRN
jgi:hypothetical protein